MNNKVQNFETIKVMNTRRNLHLIDLTRYESINEENLGLSKYNYFNSKRMGMPQANFCPVPYLTLEDTLYTEMYLNNTGLN